jgi:hypothetical protein
LKEKEIIIYSYLTEGEESGHLILDDEFWLKYFNSNNKLAKLYSSSYSCKYQKTKNPSLRNILVPLKTFINKGITSRASSILKILFTPTIKKSIVVVQGFDEVSFLFFLIRNIFNANKYVLVLTNNISSNRLKSGGWLLKKMLNIIFRFVDVVLYHTSFELELLSRFVPPKELAKFEYVKYHLMCRQDQQKPENPKVITYYGPIKYDKPIEPFLQLIESDKSNKFNYVIHNPGEDYYEKLNDLLRNRANVSISNKFITYQEYLDTVNSSAYIFLSHNKLYEGKLSGNLCDCVANRVPFISDDVSPINEFADRYGDMGYVYDFLNDKDWPQKILKDESNEAREQFILAMERMLEDYSFLSLKSELDSIFVRVQ